MLTFLIISLSHLKPPGWQSGHTHSECTNSHAQPVPQALTPPAFSAASLCMCASASRSSFSTVPTFFSPLALSVWSICEVQLVARPCLLTYALMSRRCTHLTPAAHLWQARQSVHCMFPLMFILVMPIERGLWAVFDIKSLHWGTSWLLGWSDKHQREWGWI